MYLTKKQLRKRDWSNKLIQELGEPDYVGHNGTFYYCARRVYAIERQSLADPKQSRLRKPHKLPAEIDHERKWLEADLRKLLPKRKPILQYDKKDKYLNAVLKKDFDLGVRLAAYRAKQIGKRLGQYQDDFTQALALRLLEKQDDVLAHKNPTALIFGDLASDVKTELWRFIRGHKPTDKNATTLRLRSDDFWHALSAPDPTNIDRILDACCPEILWAIRDAGIPLDPIRNRVEHRRPYPRVTTREAVAANNAECRLTDATKAKLGFTGDRGVRAWSALAKSAEKRYENREVYTGPEYIGVERFCADAYVSFIRIDGFKTYSWLVHTSAYSAACACEGVRRAWGLPNLNGIPDAGIIEISLPDIDWLECIRTLWKVRGAA
jgi:hypothetical protein